MSDGWSFTARSAAGEPRNTEQISGAAVSYDQSLHPGVLRVPVDVGDLWENINSTRNTLFHDLPSDWTSIRIKIQSFNPVQNNQQATLVAYQDDDNYVQISRTFEGFNRIMFTTETGGVANNRNSIAETATTNIFLRLDRDYNSETITSYFSIDGSEWTEVGTVIQPMTNTRLAIETGASPGGYPNADIAWAEIRSDILPTVTDELHVQPASVVFNARQGETSTETRSLFISSTFGNTITWTQSADVSWLSGNLQKGSTDGILKLSVNTSGMQVGTWHGNIRLESAQSVSGPVIIPVSLIINPEIPVTMETWKDGKSGAMSVSVDDGQSSGFIELVNNGFKGTYVYNGTSVPLFYKEFYNAGMEVGPHLVDHPCYSVTNDVLISQEILPNVGNLCSFLALPPEKIITLIWPCGYTNFREQTVAAEYFLSARGYNINELEDATPENMMNLKSFNSHEHTPFPPSDLKTVVDSAVNRRKWFNLVLHNLTNDDGAINYAKTKDIWVAPIGTIIKYIIQRDRIILDGYVTSPEGISFNVSRLPVPATVSRNFENSFEAQDLITMRVDIDDNRMVDSVLIDGVPNPFHVEKTDGNIFLLTNIRPEPDIRKNVVISYREKPMVHVNISSDVLNFTTILNKDPESQRLFISGETTDIVSWKADVGGSGRNWQLILNPTSGQLNDTMTVSVKCPGLPVGKYSKTITIKSADENFYPKDVEINLNVTDGILHQNYPNPFSSETWIEYDLPEDGPVTIDIYNNQGQKCSTILNSYLLSGNYRQKWKSGTLSSGIYFLRIKTRNYTETIKMSVLK